MKAKAFSILTLFVLLWITAGPAYGDTTYTIQPGDTLAALSRKFGVSIQAIAAANNIVNPNLIYAGQSLIIPDGTSSTSPDQPPAAPPAPAPAPPGPTTGETYVVKPGDTLTRIAVAHGVTVASLIQANGLSNPNLIYAGQILTIPGVTIRSEEAPSSQVPASPSPPAPPPTPLPTPTAPPPAPPPPPAPVPVSGNLLPNPSFENGYYHVNGVPELQTPNNWSFEFDSGQPYLRPESRVLSRAFLPDSEQALFIWNGDYTVKIFKGGAPVSFRLYSDVYLQPGTYRFTASYFPDLVASYNGPQKIWAGSGSGEVAFIKDGLGSWTSVTVGTKNTMVQTFTVPAAGNVRLGVAFRAGYNLSNNGFFIDDWSLQKLSG